MPEREPLRLHAPCVPDRLQLARGLERDLERDERRGFEERSRRELERARTRMLAQLDRLLGSDAPRLSHPVPIERTARAGLAPADLHAIRIARKGGEDRGPAVVVAARPPRLCGPLELHAALRARSRQKSR